MLLVLIVFPILIALNSYLLSAEYGSDHSLGKIGHGIRICKLPPYSFSTLLDYVWLLVTKKEKKNMAGHKHFKIYFNKDFSYELGI